MSLNKLLKNVSLALTLGVGTLLLPAGSAAAADRYSVVDPAQPSDTSGKVEVLEFFAYTCPHCKVMEPMVARWAKTLPDNVVVKPVPVAFNAGMADLQKLFYTLESMKRLDLHNKVFSTIHDERKRIFDKATITDWAAGQGLDRQAFENTFSSFGVDSKVRRANELTKAYNINGTPSLAVGGKYVTSPSMAGGYEATITEAQRLLDKVLAGN
ncbi:MAG: thiol:disulfide interchange protein DsbA/DsbL [Alcaligenaceae bacterium]|nr:thiol:disulfide interchange protein DsbA/DsbL [Alcaligenaceae bacterium]